MVSEPTGFEPRFQVNFDPEVPFLAPLESGRCRKWRARPKKKEVLRTSTQPNHRSSSSRQCSISDSKGGNAGIWDFPAESEIEHRRFEAGVYVLPEYMIRNSKWPYVT